MDGPAGARWAAPSLLRRRHCLACITPLPAPPPAAPPPPQVRAALDTIQEGLGPLPLLPAETEDGDDAAEAKDGKAKDAPAAPAAVGSKRPAVLADGTYATQAAVLEAPLPAAGPGGASAPNLRALLLGGDFFLGGVIAAALTKLVLRLRALGAPAAAANRAAAGAMLSIASILRLGEWGGLPSPLDDDSRERMVACLNVLARPEPDMVKVGGACLVLWSCMCWVACDGGGVRFQVVASGRGWSAHLRRMACQEVLPSCAGSQFGFCGTSLPAQADSALPSPPRSCGWTTAAARSAR